MMKENHALDPNEIIGHEFDYAAQTAIQANDDRVVLFGYFFATAGTILAALALVDMANTFHLAAFGMLLAGMALLGLLSLFKLIKLRLAWHDSVRAMCQIKDYYITHCAQPDLRTAFRWQTETIPPVGTAWSVTFLTAATLAILTSAFIGGALLMLAWASGKWWPIPAMAAAIVSFVSQWALWHALTHHQD